MTYQCIEADRQWGSTSMLIHPVAQAIRCRYWRTPIIIAGDNHHRLPARDPPLPSVGRLNAKQAVRSCEGIVLITAFEPDATGTDGNDLAIGGGTGTVRTQLAACRELRRYVTKYQRNRPKCTAALPRQVSVKGQAFRRGLRFPV